ncbi:ATPase, V1/A1 complex, subunit E [Cylindrobasidium torrendii FP15055 ss-10]|uniref:ATPase, V1/A1 complex, subunit E n=1 Tax=Cylindrobasidium torrendii FP15055 ss-10 TaxID=1314674 RepID=A0A0D7AV38_9AGAR|nr:ATPase, V1/A1 complex, subunit E [Cylindrobasidium torrendii FP15055 ss-10]
MSRPMNDEEVTNELNKMVAFIKQEALEKAREIKIKADEEFAIEKARLVKQEQQSIDTTYEKKRKTSEVSQKIAQSTLTNKSRLKLLQRREEHLQELFTDAREQVRGLSKDDGRYEQFLEGIITQAYLQIQESSVTVLARKADSAIAQQASSNAAKAFNEISGREIEFTVDASLPDDLAGGVTIVDSKRRLTINNTLDERLRLLEDRMLPEIRKDLFGPNENRKFYT